MDARHTDAEYLSYSFWTVDEAISIIDVKMVTTTRTHLCALTAHELPAGSRALRERSRVHGELRSSWQCVPCMDGRMAEEAAEGA